MCANCCWIDVTSNDTGNCPAATYTIRHTIPTGFTANKVNDNITLAPGASGVMEFVITSRTTSWNGTYPVTFITNTGRLHNSNYIITRGEDEPVCVRSASTVVMTPNPQTARPGTTLTYTLS